MNEIRFSLTSSGKLCGTLLEKGMWVTVTDTRYCGQVGSNPMEVQAFTSLGNCVCLREGTEILLPKDCQVEVVENPKLDISFPPSEIRITGNAPPLCGSLGKAELEHAAACLIRCYQIKNSWDPITAQEFDEFITQDNAGPLKLWILNPFFKPDFGGLITAGYARRVDDGYALTSLAVSKIAARWRR